MPRVSTSQGHPAPPPPIDAVANLRARLWDAGFRPVGLYNWDARHPSPGKAPKGDEWQRRARLNPPEAAVAPPDPEALNTGILTDGLRAIDIDIDNPTLARSVLSQITARFGEAPIRYRANSSRMLVVFRAASGQPGKRSVAGALGKIEVLGKGQQFAAFGTHDSGAVLQWMPEAPGDVTADSLAAITEEQVEEFLKAAASTIGAAPPVARSTAASPTSSSRGLRGDTLQVVAALSAIPNDAPGADWEAWNRVGMATWAATGGGSAGRAAFHAWSEQHPSYDPALTDARWDYYPKSPPTQIGAGTLFYMARTCGGAELKDDAPTLDELEQYAWGGDAPPPEDAPTAEAKQRHARQKQPKTLPFRLEWFDAIEPSLDALDFVQGTLIEGGAAVVYGESNSGKTFFVTDLALHVAAGIPWNGRRVEQGAVIYCVLEGGHGFRNRVSAWREAHDSLENPVYFACISASINLLNPDADTADLIEVIFAAMLEARMPVKLIVIDTLARAMAGGNENASEDMGALVINMDRIRFETRSAVIFVHHSGKDAAKGSRGHSSLKGAVDTEIEVVATDGDPVRVATVVKQRDLKKGDEHKFTLDVVPIGTNRHGEPVTTCLVKFPGDDHRAGALPGRRRLSQSQQRALEVLADLVAGSGRGGHAGCPAGIPSVPEDWWRDRFYERASPGANQEAKKKLFRRAADALISGGLVGMANRRVWIVYGKREESGEAEPAPE